MKEKKEYQEAEKRYRDNWTNQGLYDDDGFKSCVPTKIWGANTQTYEDNNRYMNYTFDLDLVNKADEPNFLHHYEYMINKSDFLICYVQHSCGGASKTLEYAEKKKHIEIINIFN